MGLRARLLFGCGFVCLLGFAAVVGLLPFTTERGPAPWIAAAGLLALATGSALLYFRLVRAVAAPLERLVQLVKKATVSQPGGLPNLEGRRDEIGRLTEAFSLLHERAKDVARTQAEEERLRSEMAVARSIQMSTLSCKLEADGLDMAATTIAAEEVGGDYYDVLPTKDGAWIGIGDVAGHGLPAGIIMLTVQSAISALTRQRPEATPKEILWVLNEVLFENIRHRLNLHDYVTLSLIRFYRDGRFVVGGAHEDIIVFRANQGRCEELPTQGTWIGVINDIREVTIDAWHKLEDGDVMVLFTDGVTEATDKNRMPFGIERLSAEVCRNGRQPVDRIVDGVVQAVKAWTPKIDDDLSIVALRYHAPARLNSSVLRNPTISHMETSPREPA